MATPGTRTNHSTRLGENGSRPRGRPSRCWSPRALPDPTCSLYKPPVTLGWSLTLAPRPKGKTWSVSESRRVYLEVTALHISYRRETNFIKTVVTACKELFLEGKLKFQSYSLSHTPFDLASKSKRHLWLNEFQKKVFSDYCQESRNIYSALLCNTIITSANVWAQKDPGKSQS